MDFSMSLLKSFPPDVLFGILIPIILGTLFWGFAFPFWNSARFHLILVPIGAIVPLLLAISGMRGVPPFPPVDGDGWMFPLGALALFIALYGATCVALDHDHSGKKQQTCAATGPAAVLILAMLLSAICVYPLFKNEALTLRQAEWNFVAIGAAAAVMMTLLKRSAGNSARLGVWHFFCSAIAISVLLIFSSSAYLGLLVASLAAALGPPAVLGLIRKNIFVPEAVGLGLAFLFAAAMAQGFLYAYMPLESALLVAVSPAFLALDTDGKGRVTRFFGTLCILGLALMLAGHRYFS